jgi:Protein of unknown function (DUF3263)
VSVPTPRQAAPELDRRLQDILDFERDWWKHPGPKDPAVRECFGVSLTRYHHMLNRALDLPQSLAYDPMLVRRLRRLRDARRRRRFARQFGVEL